MGDRASRARLEKRKNRAILLALKRRIPPSEIQEDDKRKGDLILHTTSLLYGLVAAVNANLAIRKEQSSTAKALKELEDLVQGQKKELTLKGSGYEVGDEKLLFKIHIKHCNITALSSSRFHCSCERDVDVHFSQLSTHIISSLQIPLRKEMAKQFCSSISRYPTAEDIQVLSTLLRCILWFDLASLISRLQHGQTWRRGT